MLRWVRDWSARRRRYGRDEEIRRLQLHIDRLEADNKILAESLQQQIEINKRDRERVRSEHVEFARRAAGNSNNLPSFPAADF